MPLIINLLIKQILWENFSFIFNHEIYHIVFDLPVKGVEGHITKGGKHFCNISSITNEQIECYTTLFESSVSFIILFSKIQIVKF